MTQKSGDLFGPGLRDQVKQYLIAKYHPESPDWADIFGPAESMSVFLKRVCELYPDDLGAIAKMLLPKLNQAQDAYREQLKVDQMRRDGIVFYSALPIGLPETCGTFASFREGGSRTLQAAAKAVREWASGVGPPMLTLYGHPGTGKTHLSTAAGAYLLEHGESVLFRREGDMMAEFRGAVPRNQVEEILDTFSSVPWLIVDDLGTASVNDGGMLGELRDRLFDARWRGAGTWKGALRTLVTTNLQSRDMPPRVASRLGDSKWGGSVIGIDAPDYRVHGPKGG